MTITFLLLIGTTSGVFDYEPPKMNSKYHLIQGQIQMELHFLMHR